jgi:uncharacterized membrane protein
VSAPEPTSRAAAAGCGAAWGLAAAGLLLAHLRMPASLAALGGGAFAGALAAVAAPHLQTWRRPGLALCGGAAGALAAFVPEPTFFLLAPLVAAALFWPFRTSASPQGIPRALPAWLVPALCGLATAVFFLQSANRYWGFGAGSKDLGLFFQTHWLIAHGLPPQNTVMGMHALADHMELLDYLVAPLLHVHDGPETLLFVQALAVASAVFPLFWMGRHLLESSRAGLAAALVWLLAPDLHLGLMFDYNPTLLGAAGLLWTAWALFCSRLGVALPIALLTCLSKENTCLYVVVLGGVAALRGVPRRRALGVAAAAAALFVIEMTVLFPRFRSGGFRHWEFEDLGDTPAETAAAAVTRPHATVDLLMNHPQKRRALLQPLATSGYLALADPLALVLQLPNWGERFLSTHRTRWWGYHYGVPGAATALIGLVLGWRRLREAGRDGPGLPRYVVACALVVGVLPPYRTPAGNRRSDLYYLRQSYVAAPADVATMREAIAFVGREPQLRVAAQDRLLPALAGRPEIYMLDRAAEADAVVLQMNGATWPDGRPSWRRRVRELWGSGAFSVVFCSGESVVLRRGAPPGLPCPAFARELTEGSVPPS